MKTRGFRTIDGQPVKNQDLWQNLEQAAGQHEIDWKWVRNHAGYRSNELCDRLAKEALEYRLNPSDAEAARPPIQKEKRMITLDDGSSQVVEVEVYPAAWAKGASRQTIGRITRSRVLRGRMK